ncbi:type I-C CRISPR-associated protein Cas5c [Syntrophomonas erecta]
MSYGIKIKVWGEYACFTRPEMKAERVSYDVMTPSAARGILEAIHWKPAIHWVIDRIHVLNEIRFDNIRRNEVGSKIPAGNIKKAMKGGEVLLCQVITEDRQQRATLMLRDVAYVIEAHFTMTNLAGEEDNPAKHYNIFLRRARQGQCYHRPYLGCREFPANFELLEGEDPVSFYQGEEHDLGWMLQDIDYQNNMTPYFFRATMRDGIIEIPIMPIEEVMR